VFYRFSVPKVGIIRQTTQKKMKNFPFECDNWSKIANFALANGGVCIARVTLQLIN
jgi:hypothetical protein